MNRINPPTLRLAALAFGLAAGLALAQSPVGALAGKAPPGAVVTIEDAKTGLTREIVTSKKGRYQMRNLPVGRYIVTVRHADGSTEPAKLVDVHIGITVRVE